MLTSWGLPLPVREYAVLAISELASKAAVYHRRHVVEEGAPVSLRLRRTPKRLIVAVRDASEVLPRVLEVEPGVADWGRGMKVVSRLAASWGARRVPGVGKTVWCEFPLQ
ncbi:ATP-binding protein [Streptomyces sp. NBC_00335]|uniref:ATP-binding protein n=1 Tax=unclassified Streptomyces TaxID=2593676 RepID=UPI002254ACA5|nr:MULTISPECIES: ATP-binding protein [unclassified Streptomyces]MCX5409733.1 ATP-binding protein [Streptomyces sp. NBC_00086]